MIAPHGLQKYKLKEINLMLYRIKKQCDSINNNGDNQKNGSNCTTP